MRPSTFSQGRWLPSLRARARACNAQTAGRTPRTRFTHTGNHLGTHWPATSPHRKRRSPAMSGILSIVEGAIVTIKELITAHQLPCLPFERHVL